MPDNQKDPGNEKLLILPLGEESKKITQVISNDTARQIIELLADAPLCASDIAHRLHAPLTTITYNLENLESVGLIKVEKIKYSEKGREVKIYAPVRKLIILVPEKTDRKSVADIIRKYLGIILTALFASSLIEFFMGNTGRNTNMMLTTSESYSLPTPAPTSVDEWIANTTSTPIPMQPLALDKGAASQVAPDIFTNLANTITAHPGLVFFLGCMFIISIFVIVEYRKRK